MYTYTPTSKFLVLSPVQSRPEQTSKFLVLTPTESGPEYELGASSPASPDIRHRSDSVSTDESQIEVTFSPFAGGFLYLGHGTRPKPVNV
ncbi:hypothetical protein ALT_7802 [Aspergillus lentulus]|uniref:Uncharacterized protein n=1 Tax=Aspergillus lentulus TaxID=293939 RepID=A0AAN5YUU3_ASPLE|nr:uncharacterized protein IFM58399_07916 [Aspergillus lentulus]KAF4155012.1 hypothetical protein CNMCM6069_008517 [Aspergillus lentulus]KAF4164153.1 hypothetical protein CNMCM6936_009516 [Aspergillus lentulus]KAF4178450.1 hypothetical protein CNMCM8060_004472 [Aspergillus lentulus]KAF4187127.1 hypothetical protein CNMCM7927_004488 [Aspergillus lentulus]KAF4193196.1 hypothetical protein CNMCM8694_009125 [Aspergillus lentulus]